MSMDRRGFAMTVGLSLAGAAAAGKAHAEPAASPAPVPPLGPWSGFGELQRPGGKLHYATIGSDNGRPPVILLHKLGGWLSDWRFVATALADRHKVYAFDLPGHGGSRWQGDAPYIQTLGETAAMLVGAFDELGFDQVDLIGTSLGGCVAVPLAAFWPERVRKLSIVSSALGPRRSLAQIKVAVDQGQVDLFDKDGNPLPTKPELLTRIFGIVNAESINVEGTASRRAAGHWIQPSERGVAITDIKCLLSRIEAPTQLIYGEYDKAYVRFRADAEHALRRFRTDVIPKSGAFVMQDNPRDTAQVLKSFLRGAINASPA